VTVRDGRRTERPDVLATEEPMEVRAHGPGLGPAAVAVTLRTPGHDFDLAVGFLHGEGDFNTEFDTRPQERKFSPHGCVCCWLDIQRWPSWPGRRPWQSPC